MPPSSPTRLNTRQMMLRLVAAAETAGIELEQHLCTAVRVKDKFFVVASTATFPSCEEDRTVMQSALHCVILHEFLNDLPADRLEVRVIVPHCAVKRMAPPNVGERQSLTEPMVSQKIQEEVQNLIGFTKQMTKSLVRISLDCTLESYPWRDALSMRAVADSLVHTCKETGWSSNIVDSMLPPLSGFLTPFDQLSLMEDVVSFLGRQPLSVLEVYESVFRIEREGRPHRKVTGWLCSQLFVA